MFSFGGGLNPSSLQTLAASAGQTLSGMSAQAQAKWAAQHKADGSHSNITCDSIVIPKLRFDMARGHDATGNIFVRDVPANGANGVPLDLGSDVMFVSIIAPGGGPYLLYGIRKQGVKFGDVIFVRKDPRSASNIEIQDRVVAVVPVNTEIHVPQDCAASYPDFFLSTSGAWLPLVYSPNVGTAGAHGWSFFYTFSA
jgi:hypothetical protein